MTQALPTLITPADLAPFATIADDKAQAMIADAVGQAVLVAPCLTDPELSAAQEASAKAVLRAAILRWNDAGSGAVVTQQAAVFSQTIDNTRQRVGVFWPSEITALQQVCKARNPRPFSVDLDASLAPVHLPWCDAMMARGSCSCGASIAGHPIYED